MIKEINIKYCEANQKYDLFVDGKFSGKFYHINEVAKAICREEESANETYSHKKAKEALKRLRSRQ